MQKITLEVSGMSCGHCVQSVEGALAEIGANGKVDLENNNVEVVFDEDAVSTAKIKQAIEEQGYDVTGEKV